MTSESQPPDPKRIAEALKAAQADGARGADELLPLVYDALRGLAQSQLARGAPRTLQATALVHEAWMRVAGETDPGWECRAHFFGAAARAMRNILVEEHRRKTRRKREGPRAELGEEPSVEIEPEAELTDILSLEDALIRLEEKDELKAEIVMLRFFTGLTMPAVAETLGLPLSRIEREWRFTRAWLAREVQGFAAE